MQTIFTPIALAGGLLALAACAPAPEPVTIVPSFDKMGNAVCPAGTVVATQAETGAQICVDAMAS